MGRKGGVRLDQLLVERGLLESREKARRAVMVGLVRVAGILERRPGRTVPRDAELQVEPPDQGYVGRGGLKLEGALIRFPLEIRGRVALDVGASTGGFTHVLLRRGARRVYAVDVGYGILHQKMRLDERVTVMERRNARHLTPEDLPEPPDLLVSDLSFISQRKVLPVVLPLLREPWDGIVLVKPQFEIGRGRVGRRGVVRSRDDHLEVLSGFLDWCGQQGYPVAGACPSPIQGAKGNREFFVHVASSPRGVPETPVELARRVVEESHDAP